MLDQFAEELRSAREKAGISLQQMALKTRIDIKFLDAIDRGDFSFLPETYVKAFLKDYSKIIGLDENKTIQKYEAAKKGQAVEEKTEDEPVPSVVKRSPPKKVQTYDATPPPAAAQSGSSLNKSIVGNILLVGGGILIVYILYLIFIKESNDIVVEEKPIEEIIEDNQQRFEVPVTDNQQLSDSLNLTIFSGDTSWVQIIYDDKRLEDFTLFPNSQKTIKADANFKITLGNSGTIRFQLNNQPLNFTGKRRAISYIQINREGLTILQNPPSLNRNE